MLLISWKIGLCKISVKRDGQKCLGELSEENNTNLGRSKETVHK